MDYKYVRNKLDDVYDDLLNVRADVSDRSTKPLKTEDIEQIKYVFDLIGYIKEVSGDIEKLLELSYSEVLKNQEKSN